MSVKGVELSAMPDVKTLYRPVGQVELDLIEAAEWRAFPPRLFWQPIFYPVLSEDYAIRIARDWNTKDQASGFVGHVLEFEVLCDFLSRYPVQEAGGRALKEYWIPAEDLPEFNRAIVGPIRLTHTFRPTGPESDAGGATISPG